MATVRIRQIRSTIKKPERQKRTLQALGIKRMHQVVEHEYTPQIKGMIEKVRHLLEIEEL